MMNDEVKKMGDAAIKTRSQNFRRAEFAARRDVFIIHHSSFII
jgi:hypothetical protein